MRRDGSDLTVFSYGLAMHMCLQAAEAVAAPASAAGVAADEAPASAAGAASDVAVGLEAAVLPPAAADGPAAAEVIPACGWREAQAVPSRAATASTVR